MLPGNTKPHHKMQGILQAPHPMPRIESDEIVSGSDDQRHIRKSEIS